MTNYYLYIRNHESYEKYNAVKLGISYCIGSRETPYITSEIKRGRFINVYEIRNISKKYPYSLFTKPLEKLEKKLAIYLKNLNKHIYIDGGTEFFSNDIIHLLPEYLQSQGLEYVLLTDEEVSRLIDEYRLNNFYKKLSRTDKDRIQTKLLEWLSRIRESKLKPLPHQLDILDKIPDFYRYNSIGKLYWACGLGKALLALFIANKLSAKTILIGVPSVYLQGQMKKEIIRYFPHIIQNQEEYILCVGGNDKTSTTKQKNIEAFLYNQKNQKNLSTLRFIITTYDSCHILASLDEKYRFDFKIGDEAHHLVIHTNENDLSEKSYIKFHDILADKSLFMTATPKIITNRKIILDAITNNNEIIYSMDDEIQFGKLIDSKSIKWAIDNKKITDFKVYVLYNTISEMRAIARQTMLNKFDDKNMELFTTAFMTLKSLEWHPELTHVLIYTNTTENSDLVAKYIFEILENQHINLPNVSRDTLSDDMYIKSLHSNTSDSKFETEVANFTKARLGIITCVYIFGEGFDLPQLNGVAMAENMISPIRTTQCALRPNRLDKNNPDKTAFIIIPYLDREECGICNQSFKKCFNVINSLRNDDDILEYKINVSSLVIVDTVPPEQIDNSESPEAASNLEASNLEASNLDEIKNKHKNITEKNKTRIVLKDNPLELEKLKLRLKHSTHLKRNESIEKDELEYMRLINRQLGITSKAMYFDSNIRFKFAHYNWIDKPDDYFSKYCIWCGWYNYLGIDTSSYALTKEEWLEYCRNIGITNYKEYYEKQKHDSRLPEFPEELYHDFKNINFELNQCNALRRRRT